MELIADKNLFVLTFAGQFDSTLLPCSCHCIIHSSAFFSLQLLVPSTHKSTNLSFLAFVAVAVAVGCMTPFLHASLATLQGIIMVDEPVTIGLTLHGICKVG
jgi:hypothetical protein